MLCAKVSDSVRAGTHAPQRLGTPPLTLLQPLAGRRVGDDALRLQGSDGRYAPQDNLLYRSSCLRLRASACSDLPAHFSVRVRRGLHSLFSYFDRDAHTIMTRFSQPGSPQQFSAAALTDPELEFTQYVLLNDLHDGMERSRRLYKQAQDQVTSQLQLFHICILVFDGIFLWSLYGAYAPQRHCSMLQDRWSNLAAQCSRSRQWCAA